MKKRKKEKEKSYYAQKWAFAESSRINVLGPDSLSTVVHNLKNPNSTCFNIYSGTYINVSLINPLFNI